tara:strand:- start:257 stop:946 length:690 start_codon:yes stop_codon:yes gene_type:complete
MIIGVNGKINSGKDTVGKIVQYLVNPLEDYTIYDWIESDDLNGRDFNFEIKKFAGKLKQTASLLTGIPVKDFEDQEFKKSYLGEEWATVRNHPLNSIPVFEDVKFNELMSVRELLQKLGTEAMRDGLHTNVWVNALFADYKGPKLSQYNPSNWIITDMRFPNEMEAIVERKGITIRVTRPVKKSKTTAKLHPSETSLDKAKFDYEIMNNGTIDNLIDMVREILIREAII